MAKTAKGWGAIAAQTARLAEEGRQVHQAEASKPDEVVASQPLEAPAPSPPPVAPAASSPAAAEAPAKTEKRSTSLYLSPAASRAIKTLAASRGIRPHRVIDDALALYLARPENGGLDFHALNGQT